MSGDLNEMTVTPEIVIDDIILLQKYYRSQKNQKKLYDNVDTLPKNIIRIYLDFINRLNYQVVVENYKKQYIFNEEALEPDMKEEEMIGLGRIYDYIASYDFNQKEPDICVDGLVIHSKLYSACPYPDNRLRTDPVVLYGLPYEVPDAKVAKELFQSYIGKRIEFDKKNVFKYIDECIRITTELIKVQPYADGNKRTFRGLLNLMFARIGIPPVYVVESERTKYKEELFKAIMDDDYEGLIRFYYYKICDAIVDLDLTKSKENNNGKPIIIETDMEKKREL